MKKIIVILLIIVISIFTVKIGDLVLRYTNEEYRAKKKIETWNSRINEFYSKKLEEEVLSSSPEYTLENDTTITRSEEKELNLLEN